MDVTILNGRKHMKHSKRTLARKAARHNPDGLAGQAGAALLATAIAVPTAIFVQRTVTNLKKGGTGADKDAPRFDANQGAGLILAASAVVGVGLHVRNYAPRAGIAVLAAGATLAAKQWWDARALAKAAEERARTQPPPSANPTSQPGANPTSQPGANPTTNPTTNASSGFPRRQMGVRPAGAAVGCCPGVIDTATGKDVVLEDLNRRVAAEEASHVLEAMNAAQAEPAAAAQAEPAAPTSNAPRIVAMSSKAPAKYPSIMAR